MPDIGILSGPGLVIERLDPGLGFLIGGCEGMPACEAMVDAPRLLTACRDAFRWGLPSQAATRVGTLWVVATRDDDGRIDGVGLHLDSEPGARQMVGH